MITWIQRYFQSHFKTIFAVLLAVIIVSFVFTIGAAPGIGDGSRRGLSDRPFFKYNLALEKDQERLMGDAGLSANLRVGAFGGLDAAQIQNYAFQRAATLHLADLWHIPAATAAEIETQIKTLRMFSGPNGQFDAKAYQTFRDNLKANARGVTEADIARIVSDDVRAEKVNNLLAGPGYVLPADIRNQLTRADTSWTLATATVSYTDFKPELKPTDAEITQFFEQAGGRYDIPPRAVVSYVDFSVTQFIAGISVAEAEVRAYYDANPARFPKPADAKSPPPAVAAPNANADYAAVRSQVEMSLKVERAQKLAAKAAADFAHDLYVAKATTPAAIENFLAGRKVAPKAIAPFSRDDAPAELGRSPDAVAEAFRLGKDRLVSDAIPVPTGAVVLFWKDLQPTRKPLLSEVRDRVVADFTENEKRKRFVELGRSAKSQLEARLKAGDAFEKAAAAVATATGLKFETKALPAFTLRDRPQDIDFTVIGALEKLEKGQVSDLSVNANAGVFVYAADKKLPDLTEANPRYAETRTQLASFTARLGASAYLSELVEQELKKSEPKS